MLPQVRILLNSSAVDSTLLHRGFSILDIEDQAPTSLKFRSYISEVCFGHGGTLVATGDAQGQISVSLRIVFLYDSIY